MNISEETIDSFLRGDLKGAELERFNQALSADPKLQQEVSFQQDVVDSIKQYRHNQLKSRLNSIEVSPISTGSATSTYFKLAASIGIVALLIGTFAVLTNTKGKNTLTNATETSSKEDVLTANIEEVTPSDIVSSEQKTSTSTNGKSETKDTKITATSSEVSTKKSDVKKSTDNPDQTSTHTSFPSDEEMTSDDMAFDSKSENFTVPTINNTEHSTISASVVKVNIVKEKNLAYRYFNNELYLHGNFSNSTYELFELNNKPSKQLFLYFENHYYELIQGKTKVTDLVPITDKATLLQLAQLREH
jgi:hypothetical protein